MLPPSIESKQRDNLSWLPNEGLSLRPPFTQVYSISYLKTFVKG